MVPAGSEGVLALRKLVSHSWSRVRDVFAAWDEDGSGSISRSEWARALNGLRLSVTSDEAHALFDMLDEDGSGSIDFNELHQKLRQGQGIELDEALRDGARGEIETSAHNKHELRAGPQTTRSRACRCPCRSS